MTEKLFFVFIGGGLGCVLRYTISKYIFSHYKTHLPLATFLSNVLSCLLLASFLYLLYYKVKSEHHLWQLLLITGFCGGLSTFSTFSIETFYLLKNNHYSYAILNVVLSMGICLLLLFAVYKLFPKIYS